jgi:hypothetical protein
VKINLEALLIRLQRSLDAGKPAGPVDAKPSLIPKSPAGRKVYLDKLAEQIERYMEGHLS